MSLCLILQNEDAIFMAADSRESVAVGDEFYATGREVQKIYVVGTQVIAVSGVLDITRASIAEYEQSGVWTLENLREIMKMHVLKFINQYGLDFNVGSEYIGAVIGCYEDEKTKFYAIRSADDFRIIENIGTPLRACGGVHMDSALAILKGTPRLGDVIDNFHHVYSCLADESVGGHMTCFIVDKSGIRCVQRRIQDTRVIKTLSPKVLLRDKGLTIEREDHSSKVILNSDQLTFQANGQDRLYFDPVVGRYVFNGTLEAADGIFSGSLQAADGTFTGTLHGVDGVFTGDLQAVGGTFTGTLVGGDGTFIGTLQAATINGGTINGSTIIGSVLKTANSGRRIEIDQAGFRSYDSNGNNRVQIATTNDSSAAAVIWRDSNGSSVGEINSYQSSGVLTLFSNNLTIGSNNTGNPIRLQGAVTFGGPVDGLGISDVDGLQSKLADLQNQIEAVKYTLNNHKHSVTLPTHNHGLSNATNWGGTFQTSTP